MAACLALAPAAHADSRSLELLSVGPQAGDTQPYSAYYAGSTPDGSHVFFRTDEQLVPADHDAGIDVYMRAGGVTTLISGGDAGGQADFYAASPDGSRVVFGTEDKLDATADTDTSYDLYEWHDGTITLLTDGRATGTDPNNPVDFAGSTPDLAHVYFSTAEPITADDTDSVADIFERSGGTTKRISVGTPGHDTTEAVYDLYGASPDGSRAYFETAQSLDPADDDSHYSDIYERTGSTTKLLTDGPGPDYPDHVHFDALSADGTQVMFDTPEALTSDDTDGTSRDVYIANDNGITLATPGTSDPVEYCASDPGLSKILFSTSEQLTPGDTDSAYDLYIRSGSSTALVTPGTHAAGFDAASKDLSRVFFSTTESLTAADTDGGAYDGYEQDGAVTSLVTTGPADPQTGGDEYTSPVSDDGSRALIYSGTPFTADDTDSSYDVFERSGGVTRLVSTGGDGSTDVELDGATPDGHTVFIGSDQQLVPGDSDGGGWDVFASHFIPDPPPSGGGAPPTDTHNDVPTGLPADVRAPRLKTVATARQRLLRQKGVLITLSADENSTATVAGTISVPKGARVLRFKTARRALRAGAKAKVKLTLPKAALKQAAAALGRGRKLKAKLTIVDTDAAGNRSTKKLTIALAR